MTIKYEYDAENRRVVKETPAGLYRYYWDGIEEIEEDRIVRLNGVEIAWLPMQTYVHGPGVDRIISYDSMDHEVNPRATVEAYAYMQNIVFPDPLDDMITTGLSYVLALVNVTTPSPPGRYFVHQDWQMNTVMITLAKDVNPLGLNSGQEALPLVYYDYDTYGQHRALYSIHTPPTDPGYPFLFTGRRLDGETGNYHYRARYYNPDQGRFISTDPIGIWRDVTNYGNGWTYVGNDPSSFTDPTGNCKVWKKSCRRDMKDAVADAAGHVAEFAGEVVDTIYVDLGCTFVVGKGVSFGGQLGLEGEAASYSSDEMHGFDIGCDLHIGVGGIPCDGPMTVGNFGITGPSAQVGQDSEGNYAVEAGPSISFPGASGGTLDVHSTKEC